MTRKNNEYSIVPMQKHHVLQVEALERASFSSPWSAKMISEELENDCGRYLVAESAGKLCGYVGLQVILDEGYITNIAVAEPWRRKGIARALLQTLIAQNNALSFLTLEVRAGNEAAIALYRGFGFREVGVRKNYYQKPCEDAILMTRWFQKQNGEIEHEDTGDRKLM